MLEKADHAMIRCFSSLPIPCLSPVTASERSYPGPEARLWIARRCTPHRDGDECTIRVTRIGFRHSVAKRCIGLTLA
jgi:hypothetical protein